MLLIVAFLGKGLVRRKRNNLETKENHLNLPTILLHIVILVSMIFSALFFFMERHLDIGQRRHLSYDLHKRFF
jgi:cytochrome b561